LAFLGPAEFSAVWAYNPLIGVGEDRVRPEIDPDPAGKTQDQQQATGNGALLLEPGMEDRRLQAKFVKP
jgi:hypothetical protein